MRKTLPSYTSGTAEVPLLGMTIGEMLDRTAEQFPDNEALVCLHQGIRWTYREFVEKVNEAARAFMAKRPGFFTLDEERAAKFGWTAATDGFLRVLAGG